MTEALSLKGVKNGASLVGEKTANIKEQLEDLGRAAGRKLEGAQRETAGALHSAASPVRAAAHEGSKAIDEFGDSAVARLESTSACVRRFDMSGMVADLRSLSAAILVRQ
jgi:hypothetical protein